MTTFENVVAVDWRSEYDQIYFFFKGTNTYSRFSIRENQVPTSYPLPVSCNWGGFHNAQNLRFGFTTTGFDTDAIDGDILWLFDRYGFGKNSPCVHKYNQDTETLIRTLPLEKTRWHQLVPYFDKIIAGTWWQTRPGRAHLFRFLLNNGKALRLDFGYGTIIEEDINEKTWPGLSAYKDRIITAAQNDRTLVDNYLYIFLTNNEYIRYNIQENRAESGPITIDNESWPGLLRG
ncbi:hypothetical protein PMI30_06107 [Pseudomonas sp. GM50]|uniref:hypothetical protein n=1 Tax=Pseudomonas sp. GM50 TaxID=1144332 RepID=UPI000270CFAA|nr:hypothetical protein [Pseudomonas sp. GM50]EJM58523.1 hypothetical protein PMI30_06107 [Pseudomonas sp. GM50]